MNTLTLYNSFSLFDAVSIYFQNSQLEDEIAKYLIWFSSLFDPSRHFIMAIYKRYEVVTAFNRDITENIEHKHLSGILDETETPAKMGSSTN